MPHRDLSTLRLTEARGGPCLLLGFSLLLSCGEDHDGDSEGMSLPPAPSSVLPYMQIVSPRDGEEVPAGELEVIVDLRDFRLVPPEAGGAQGSLPWPGAGWLLPQARAHGDPSDPSGYLSLTLNGGSPEVITESIFTLELKEPGSHRLELELTWADGDRFYPWVEDAVEFTVTGD